MRVSFICESKGQFGNPKGEILLSNHPMDSVPRVGETVMVNTRRCTVTDVLWFVEKSFTHVQVLVKPFKMKYYV